jgi:hypothetical protein
MMDNFAAHPRSIGELRSDRSERSHDWTPRDALISLLREIDEGRSIDALVIAFRYRDDDGKMKARFRAASPDGHTTLGMLTSAIFEMQTP